MFTIANQSKSLAIMVSKNVVSHYGYKYTRRGILIVSSLESSLINGCITHCVSANIFSSYIALYIQPKNKNVSSKDFVQGKLPLNPDRTRTLADYLAEY